MAATLLVAAVPAHAAEPSEAGAGTAPPVTASPAFKEPDWDRVANIKEAAKRLGQLQRARGATGVMSFIDACYKTHGLASEYRAAFEACIAQDYMQTKLLSNVYARLPPEQLARMRVPSPHTLADAMGRRIVAAFSQYSVPVAYAEGLKLLVDEHGLPIYLKAVFPNAKIPSPPGPGKPPEGALPEPKDKDSPVTP